MEINVKMIVPDDVVKDMFNSCNEALAEEGFSFRMKPDNMPPILIDADYKENILMVCMAASIRDYLKSKTKEQ